MGKNRKENEKTQIRRSERGKDDQWIKEFLRNAPFGTLGTAVDDQPFLVTKNFVYDEEKHAIYFHGAREGRTFQTLLANPKVCFSTSRMGRLIPSDEACDFSVEYEGVVVFGRAEIINEPGEARHALQLMLGKYFPHLKPGEDYRPITGGSLSKAAVVCLHIDAWSGKARKASPEEAQNAFMYSLIPPGDTKKIKKSKR